MPIINMEISANRLRLLGSVTFKSVSEQLSFSYILSSKNDQVLISRMALGDNTTRECMFAKVNNFIEAS